MEILETIGKLFDAIGQSSRHKKDDDPGRQAEITEIKNPLVRVTHKLANLITLQPLRNRGR